MDINETILAFQCCIQIPPDCTHCPQEGPGFGIACRQAVKENVLSWLNATREVMELGSKDKD